MGSGISHCGTQREFHNKKSRDCDQCCKCQNSDTVADSQPAQVITRAGASNTHVLKLFNNGTEENAATSSSAFQSEQRKKFYFYPKRNGGQDLNETLFVTSSQFPYARPKAVVVRPRPVEKVAPQVQVNNTDSRKEDVNNVHGKEFLMYNEEYPTAPYGMRGQIKSHHFVNERRWANPNVMPTERYPCNTVLPHKTVLELRGSTQVQPYGRHYSYVSDMEPSIPSENLIRRDRPPAPGTNIWYPARRTRDYLVASSLLAAEQTREAHKINTIDVHDF